MKRQIMQVTLPICGAILVGGAWLANAGSLTPPAGAITGTGRFGPRVDLNSLTPAELLNLGSGSYYLSADRSDRIQITGANVTIDLNGFTLTAGAGNGISCSGGLANIAIKNGVISGRAGDGIDVSGCQMSLVEDVRVNGSAEHGIQVGVNSIVRNCIVQGSASGNGIQGGENCVIEGCTSSDNSLSGIEVSAGSNVTNCSANDNNTYGISADASLVRGNSATDNGAGGTGTENFNLTGGTSEFENHGI